MLCKGCGLDNPPEETWCAGCNSRLEEAPRSQATFYEGIELACEAFLSSRWTALKFLEYLDEVEQGLALQVEHVQSVLERNNYEASAAEEVTVGRAALAELAESLRLLRQGASQTDLKALEAGIRLAYQGSARLTEAMRLNREARQAAEEEWQALGAAMEAQERELFED